MCVDEMDRGILIRLTADLLDLPPGYTFLQLEVRELIAHVL